ncbi:hypothetical protein GQ457_12G015250 [Hibiscus cannabinus]
MGESIYVLQYFHGGKFRTTPKFEYVNGLIEKDPDSDFNCDGLVLIHNDETVRQVIQLLVTKGIVDIYVDHKVEEDGSPKVNDDTKVNVEGVVIEALQTDIKGLEVVGGAVDDDDGPMGDADDGQMGDADGLMEDTDGFDLDDGPMEDTGGVKEATDGDDGGPSVVAGADGGPNVDSDSYSTTEDENDEKSFLHNIEITSDVVEDLDNIRRNMKNSKRRRKTVVDEGNEDTDDAMVGDDVVDEIESKENDGKLEGNKSEYLDSSNPGEYGGSDESEAEVCGTFVGQKTVGPRYDPNCSVPTWELGMRFEDNLQFKEDVRKYSVAKGVKLNFVKNEPNRTRLCCKGNCPWLIFASHDSRYDCYVLKTYNPIRKCYRSNKNTLLSCKMIEKKFKDMILSNPKMKVSTLQEVCQSELGAYATYNMCQRARKNVLKEKNGSYVEEFASLWGYAAELIASNPGSTMTIQVDRDSAGIATFHRMYICLAAVKQCWIERCSPFIGVDGCFLKTVTKGALLVVVGRDANNQMFPVAWAVVEEKGKESWRWFLQKLMVDLDHPNGEGITLMSDMQKGLIPVLRESFRDVDHRMCARHIYANWFKKWKGMNRKFQFWNCVRATFVEDFDLQIQGLEALGPTSSNDLFSTPVQHWSKAYFKATSKCDVVDNNMAEAFNGWRVEARAKSIISMLEQIRIMVMSRMTVKRNWAEKWRTNISPRALEKLERNMTTSTQCRLVWNGDGGFEVTHLDNQHTVDLNKLSCTCREWEISGIPCCHAICAMFHDSKSPEDYASEWYNKEKYMATYKHVLQPVRGEKFWPKGLPSILPPTVKVQPGRPKNKRTKAKDEPKKMKVGKFTKAGARMRCSKCRTSGHNIQNCPQKSTNVASSQVHTNETVNRASQPHEPISIGQTHVTKSTTVPSGSQKSGLGFQTTVTPPTNAPKKIGASTSHFDHTWKGLGLSWKGKKAEASPNQNDPVRRKE